jgi:hypothetical protein
VLLPQAHNATRARCSHMNMMACMHRLQAHVLLHTESCCCRTTGRPVPNNPRHTAGTRTARGGHISQPYPHHHSRVTTDIRFGLVCQKFFRSPRRKRLTQSIDTTTIRYVRVRDNSIPRSLLFLIKSLSVHQFPPHVSNFIDVWAHASARIMHTLGQSNQPVSDVIIRHLEMP